MKKVKNQTIKKIALCTLVEHKKGYGNFNRSLVLGEKLIEKKNQILFIIKPNEKILQILDKKKIPYKILKERIGFNKGISELKNILQEQKCTDIILDLREFSEKYSKSLQYFEVNTVIIDDAWVKNSYSDIIFNGTPISKYHNYVKRNKYSKIFVGPKYWIANENFKKYRKKISSIKTKKKYLICIIMGGSDPNNFTIQFAKILQEYLNLKIIIITGPLYQNKNHIKKIITNNNQIQWIESSSKIWTYFLKSDLVITAAGNTLYELLIQRIPTICIPVIRHQIPYTEYFTQRGCIKQLRFSKKIDKKIFIKTLNEILYDTVVRKNMVRNAQKILDGNGTERVSKIIINQL